MPSISHRESVRLGNSLYPSRPRQLGWHVGTERLVRRKPIRGWPPALPLSLRRRSANFSNSIPVQGTRWLEFDGSWSYKQSERRDRSSRWHYLNRLGSFNIHDELAVYESMHGRVRAERTHLPI